jgi:hypothetical protein
VRAVWPAERAERVIGCKAWGALAYQLAQLEDQGYDVTLLYGVPDFVDRGHTPAALAFRSIEERLDDAGAERAVATGQRAGERGERAAQQADQDPPGTAGQQAEADPAQQQADLHADRAAGHEAYAAELAAQGYPSSTRRRRWRPQWPNATAAIRWSRRSRRRGVRRRGRFRGISARRAIWKAADRLHQDFGRRAHPPGSIGVRLVFPQVSAKISRL